MYDRDDILRKVHMLLDSYRRGLLGGERMPEHENPHLDVGSRENYMYFTLPMALNYQRNSYKLWECANRMYADEDARAVFDSRKVYEMPEEVLREYLTKYKVALQPNRHPAIWKKLCETIETQLDGDIRNLFIANGRSVKEIKAYIQANKKAFPYLGGTKICNYWLHVIEQYTDMEFSDRENITVAPDTHIIQASERLGVISREETAVSNIQDITAGRWDDILAGTDIAPIDLHTPMWLWSRGKFETDII
ncbi:MAG: hypothetical protein IJC56_01195 [Clostridia bacterium]|nr:hypothetical protein [Clostridia bacterium]